MQQYILLDIDGVMVPASGWKPVELHQDGFYKFSYKAQKSLERLLEATGATIILTTTHRTRYTSMQWKELLSGRIKSVFDVQTLDDACKPDAPVSFRYSRLDDVVKWVNMYGDNRYVIIDDDTSLHALPGNVLMRWVKTSPDIGFNEEAAEKALRILNTPV